MVAGCLISQPPVWSAVRTAHHLHLMVHLGTEEKRFSYCLHWGAVTLLLLPNIGLQMILLPWYEGATSSFENKYNTSGLPDAADYLIRCT